MKHPPARLPGWRTAAPDFVGVGMQKAGTSWWHVLIRSHPGVSSRVRPRELHFFDHLEPPLSEPDIERYHRFFPRRPGTIAGEWTPRYVLPPGPSLLAAAAPEARILVLLRDPVERYFSALRMASTRRQDPEDEATRADALARGRYASLLEGLFQYFDPERVLVLQFERCLLDLRGELGRTYRFLGLDPEFFPSNASQAVNVSLDRIDAADERRRELVVEYEPEVERLTPLVRELDLELWPNFRHLVRG